jgi:hypothetical protein
LRVLIFPQLEALPQFIFFSVADHMQSIFAGYRGVPPLFTPTALLSHLPPPHSPAATAEDSKSAVGGGGGLPFNPAAFVNFQNSLKLKQRHHHHQPPGKQLARTAGRLALAGGPNIAGGGVQPAAKRKSREGTTTYLWEFLLKLLQVCYIRHPPPPPHLDLTNIKLLYFSSCMFSMLQQFDKF